MEGKALYTLISFFVVGIIFLLVLAITFKIMLKNYDVEKSKLSSQLHKLTEQQQVASWNTKKYDLPEI